MNHTEFLQDFIDTYVADPSKRAINPEDDRCSYLMDDGRKCAIGRHILPGTYNKSCENKSACAALEQHPKMFPEWMKQLNQSFLHAVQSFHDININWTKTGLSLRGERQLTALKSLAKQLDDKIVAGQ